MPKLTLALLGAMTFGLLVTFVVRVISVIPLLDHYLVLVWLPVCWVAVRLIFRTKKYIAYKVPFGQFQVFNALFIFTLCAFIQWSAFSPPKDYDPIIKVHQFLEKYVPIEKNVLIYSLDSAAPGMPIQNRFPTAEFYSQSKSFSKKFRPPSYYHQYESIGQGPSWKNDLGILDDIRDGLKPEKVVFVHVKPKDLFRMKLDCRAFSITENSTCFDYEDFLIVTKNVARSLGESVGELLFGISNAFPPSIELMSVYENLLLISIQAKDTPTAVKALEIYRKFEHYKPEPRQYYLPYHDHRKDVLAFVEKNLR